MRNVDRAPGHLNIRSKTLRGLLLWADHEWAHLRITLIEMSKRSGGKTGVFNERNGLRGKTKGVLVKTCCSGDEGWEQEYANERRWQAGCNYDGAVGIVTRLFLSQPPRGLHASLIFHHHRPRCRVRVSSPPPFIYTL